jgi:hypothetical protein
MQEWGGLRRRAAAVFGPASVALAVLLFSAGGARAEGVVCAAVSGNIVSNCGFETGDFTGWTVGGATSGNFDGNYWGVQGDLNDPPEGATVLGPVNSGSWAAYFWTDDTGTLAPITLSQQVTGPIGVLYTIAFYIDQDALTSTNTFSVTFAGATLTSVTNMAPTNGFKFETFTYNDVSVVNPLLQFSFENPPDYFFLDDVEVTGPVIAPEPEGMPLGGEAIGLLLLAALKHGCRETARRPAGKSDI